MPQARRAVRCPLFFARTWNPMRTRFCPIVLVLGGVLGCVAPREPVPPGGARVRFLDLRNPVEISLASASMEPYKTEKENGTLPRGLKLIPDEEMQNLLGFMRERRFWDFAVAVPPSDPSVQRKVKSLIVLETKDDVRTFPFPAEHDRVKPFVEMKARIQEIFEKTTQFAGVR
jgi:hypothetical protein